MRSGGGTNAESALLSAVIICKQNARQRSIRTQNYTSWKETVNVRIYDMEGKGYIHTLMEMCTLFLKMLRDIDVSTDFFVISLHSNWCCSLSNCTKTLS